MCSSQNEKDFPVGALDKGLPAQGEGQEEPKVGPVGKLDLGGDAEVNTPEINTPKGDTPGIDI
jgi:hypothetical protein